MRQLSNGVLWGAVALFIGLYVLVFYAKGQDQFAARQHIGLFYRGQMAAEVYADDVIQSTGTETVSFWRAGNLVLVMKNDSGLVWKVIDRTRENR